MKSAVEKMSNACARTAYGRTQRPILSMGALRMMRESSSSAPSRLLCSGSRWSICRMFSLRTDPSLMCVCSCEWRHVLADPAMMDTIPFDVSKLLASRQMANVEAGITSSNARSA